MVGRLARADHERSLLTNQVREVEKIALIGRLSASVAHEINNPLQIITDQAGLMDELMDEEQPDAIAHFDDYRKSIGKIRTQIGRTRTITHRLLGFSRAQEYASPPRPTSTRPWRRRWRCWNTRPSATGSSSSGITRTVCPRPTPTPAQIQQVVLNILHNAMDAIGQDGAIDVTSRLAGERIVVDFADSGPGLTAEVLAHLYDPFFTTKPKGKGTGLGLFVSRDIMATARRRTDGGEPGRGRRRVLGAAAPAPTARSGPMSANPGTASP